MLSNRLSYERNFIELKGKLIAVDEYPEDRGFWRSPRFTFRSESGEIIEFKSDLGHVWLSYRVLDEVTILFDPKTKAVVIAGFEELYAPVLVLAFAGLVIWLIFLIFPLLLYRYLYPRNGTPE
jgi:hypothetical protein